MELRDSVKGRPFHLTKEEILESNLNLLGLPKVHKEKNGTVVVVDFEPMAIYDSLLKETDLGEKKASELTVAALRIICKSSNGYITPRMIREILCELMFVKGLRKERAQYTVIGLPYADIVEIKEKHKHDRDHQGIINSIGIHGLWEFNEVQKLIEGEEK